MIRKYWFRRISCSFVLMGAARFSESALSLSLSPPLAPRLLMCYLLSPSPHAIVCGGDFVRFTVPPMGPLQQRSGTKDPLTSTTQTFSPGHNFTSVVCCWPALSDAHPDHFVSDLDFASRTYQHIRRTCHRALDLAMNPPLLGKALVTIALKTL